MSKHYIQVFYCVNNDIWERIIIQFLSYFTCIPWLEMASMHCNLI